jgi:hypothetical protein
MWKLFPAMPSSPDCTVPDCTVPDCPVPDEEERGVGDVLEGFGPVIQLRLEVLLGDRVAAHRVQRQHVLAHEVEELA